MGAKKDASSRAPPVERYRKEIGKQDWKKSKKEMKAMKRRADEKSSQITARQIAGIGVIIILVFVGIYLVFLRYMDAI